MEWDDATVSLCKKLSNELLTTNLLKSLLRISDVPSRYSRQSQDSQHLEPVLMVEKPGMILRWAKDQQGHVCLRVPLLKVVNESFF